jgi:hypothetical protein
MSKDNYARIPRRMEKPLEKKYLSNRCWLGCSRSVDNRITDC